MSTRLRWLMWLGALGVIGFFAMKDGQDEELVEVVVPGDEVKQSTSRIEPKAQLSSLQWQLLESRTQQPQPRADLFAASHSTLPEKQAAMAIAERATSPEAKPVIPFAPFRYLGQLDVGEEDSLVMLSDGIRVYTVHPGRNINAEWRLDRSEAQSLLLTYLPLNAPQIMPKSTSSLPQQDEQKGNS